MRVELGIVLAFVFLLTGCGAKPARTAGPPVPPPPPPGVGQAVPPPPPPPGTPPAATQAVAPLKPAGFLSDSVLAQKSTESAARLKQIGEALHAYQAQHNNSFPPAYVQDKEGKPLYSWRVLLLPHLGQQALFDRFDKKQAWDSPANLEISNQALDIFKSPADPTVAANGVNYVAIVGPGFFFSDDWRGTKISAVSDGLMHTIAVLELRGVAGSWAAPVDPKVDGLQWKLGEGAGELHSPYPKKLQFVTGFKEVKFLDPHYVTKAFPHALGIADGTVNNEF